MKPMFQTGWAGQCLFALFVICFPCIAKAQYTESVHLKSGSEINGMWKPHYEGGVDAGLSLSIDSQQFNFGIFTTHGCLVTPYLYLGLGLGMNNYFQYVDGSSLPVFGDIRLYFCESKERPESNIKPFIGVRAGYDALLRGLYLNPSIGVRYRIIDLCVGYTFNRTAILYFDDLAVGRISLHNLNLKIGVRF